MYIKNDICYADQYDTTSIKVKKVKALPGLMLLITFTSGEMRLFDCTKLTGSAFVPLKDEDVFNNINIFHGVPTWLDGEIDIAPETLFYDGIPYNTFDEIVKA